ncbi:hypothetical protein D3C78_1979500 [compost metagenome]
MVLREAVDRLAVEVLDGEDDNRVLGAFERREQVLREGEPAVDEGFLLAPGDDAHGGGTASDGQKA